MAMGSWKIQASAADVVFDRVDTNLCEGRSENQAARNSDQNACKTLMWAHQYQVA
jgi:hypothetical protein